MFQKLQLHGSWALISWKYITDAMSFHSHNYWSVPYRWLFADSYDHFPIEIIRFWHQIVGLGVKSCCCYLAPQRKYYIPLNQLNGRPRFTEMFSCKKVKCYQIPQVRSTCFLAYFMFHAPWFFKLCLSISELKWLHYRTWT
jgi:hypothetical protein